MERGYSFSVFQAGDDGLWHAYLYFNGKCVWQCVVKSRDKGYNLLSRQIFKQTGQE